jgi:hypothetical protein
MESLLRFACAFALSPFDRHSLQYSPAVVTEEVRERLMQHFFPHGIHRSLDMTTHSPFPQRFVNEIRRLFLLIDEDIQSLSWNRMLQSMHAVVVAHCLTNQHIQFFGNAKFRLALCAAFNAEHNESFPQGLRDRAEADRNLLQHARDTIDVLCSAEKLKRPLVRSEHDSIFTPGTREDEVVHSVMLSEFNMGNGPLTLLEWDADTELLFDFVFGSLFAFANPPPVENINRPSTAQNEWQVEAETYDMLHAHFGGRSPTKDDVRCELKLASSGICVDYLGGPILSYLRRKIHGLCLASGTAGGGNLDGGFARQRPAHLQIVPPFPFQVLPQQTDWPISFTHYDIGHVHTIGFTQENYGASFHPFLARGEVPELVGAKRERIAREANRCFFIHLGAALDIHPVYLQVIFCTPQES